MKRCIDELARASAADPQFVDAKIGEASCIVNLAVLNSGEERNQGYRRHRELLDEAKKMAPENPRLAWVLGATLWYSPPQFGGGQDKGFEAYQQGLVWARKEHVTDPLDPAWGEPELLMNLAFASLNATTPDLEAADRYAHEAVKLVPTWHYVRDLLIPQIQAINQQQETFVHDLLRRGLTRIYSDYWTCDRTTFQSKEKIICSDLIFINGQLKAHDRYAPYYTIVHANLHAAYILRIGSTEAETFAQKIESHTDQQFFHFRMDGYEVYQLW